MIVNNVLAQIYSCTLIPKGVAMVEEQKAAHLFRSPLPDVTIPEEGVVQHILQVAAEDADRVAVVDDAGGLTLTYGQLAQSVEVWAGRLRAELGADAVVALVGGNSAHWVVAFLGCLRAGLVVTTVNVLATAEEMIKQFQDAAVTHVIADDERWAVTSAAAVGTGLSRDRIRPLSDVMLGADHDLPAVRPIDDPATKLAVLPYSSGTTGRPKGVMLTHGNLVANLCQIEQVFGVDRHSSVLAFLPFSHMYGMTVVLNLALKQRAKVIVMRRFDMVDLLSMIEDQRITHLFVAPPVVVQLAKSNAVAGRDFSSVRILVSAAAPLDENLADTVATRLGCEVRQAYGMSEMSPVSHVAPLTGRDVPLSSVGMTLPNMVCRIVDPVTGVDVEVPSAGPSAPGELCCAGPNVMAGYLGNEHATREAIDPEGFLRTGDIATIDAHGVVTIVDRLKELIKYKGYQVAPAELEGLLLEHGSIVDAAVVGVPVGDAGDEAPRAFVVRRPGAELSAAEVIEHVASRVAPYKKVRSVEFIDAIPKSPSGKILRRQLRSAL